MQPPATLDRLSDDELLRRLDELVAHSRRVEADLVAHIGEVERRRLYAREASPSMFAYCRERLHLSEAEAYMRSRVARAARRHPLLLDMLRDGRLHLCGIVRLLPVLTPANRDAVLARATFCAKRQILELVAELSPPAGRAGPRAQATAKRTRASPTHRAGASFASLARRAGGFAFGRSDGPSGRSGSADSSRGCWSTAGARRSPAGGPTVPGHSRCGLGHGPDPPRATADRQGVSGRSPRLEPESTYGRRAPVARPLQGAVHRQH